MRILAITDRFPPLSVGGYEIACQSITERLRERGHEVLVLTSNYGLDRGTRDGHIHRVLHRPQDSPSLLTLARWEIQDNATLENTAKDWKPDIVSLWSMLQLFPSLYRTLQHLDVPVVVNLHDIWLPRHIAEGERLRQAWLKNGSNPLKDIVKKATRSTMRISYSRWLEPVSIDDVPLDHAVFCSRFRRDQHISAGLPLGDSRVIYNGIDLNRFYRGPRPVDPGHLKLLFVGRLVHEKGVHTLVEAVRMLVKDGVKNISLNIVGVPAYPWEYSERLKSKVHDNGLADRVRFLDPVVSDRMGEVYRNHDLLVFPSIGDEGFPMAVLEAMACGTVVIGTNTGGTGEILENGVTGIVFDPGDAAGLAGSISRLMADPALAPGLAHTAKELVRERFDLQKIAAETEHYLSHIAAKRHERATMVPAAETSGPLFRDDFLAEASSRLNPEASTSIPPRVNLD